MEVEMTMMKRRLWVLFGLALVVGWGCGGTKVVNEQKTILHGGNTINVTNVVRISSKITVTLPDGSTNDVTHADKAAVEELLKAHGSLNVTTALTFDDQSLTYEARTISKAKELEEMRKTLDKATKKIQKFMKSSSKQLKL